jgi:hypothetical protein
VDTVVMGDGIRIGGAHPEPVSRALGTGDGGLGSGEALLEAAEAVPTCGIGAQACWAPEGIRTVLERAATSLAKVVKTTAEPRDFRSFNYGLRPASRGGR